MEIVVARCAGLDVHQKTVLACVRVPGRDGQRVEKVRRFATFTGQLLLLRDWLRAEDVTQVAMEATGVYWRPVWHVLESQPGWELLLVNPHHVKKVPGRKTDVSDAGWLAQLCECGLLRGSFVPPPVIAELRDLTRYRKKLIEDRAREVQRIQKLLEDAGIKLSSVASDTLGVSGRAMLEALLAGEDDPATLAELARTRLRAKRGTLREAMRGWFGEHHRVMLRAHLTHIDQLSVAIDGLDGRIAHVMSPFDERAERLMTIPGVGRRTAEVIIAEIGVDMAQFPTAAHLASWAGMCPGNNESAGKRKTGRTRKGDPALRTALVEAAWAASRSQSSYLSAQYRRLARRMGKTGQQKAIYAVGHSILVIAWHLLANNTDYTDLGGDYFAERQDTQLLERRLVRRLEQLGHKVTLEPTAA